MAVQALPLFGTLVLRLSVGLTDDGKPIYRTRRWSGIKPTAANGDVYAVAEAFAGLQEHIMTAVEYQRNSELADDGE
ncbi:MAG: DUF1659 domain-containing protein [Eubacteriales bacterium]|jgi:hypothetical protein|nr:DUF1659 domain-containing protein [Pseudomonadota bacterium]MBU4532595.1 DUF1659 domain-containing protein [Bacillota bacterium]MBV1728540.1 DUF1659 domain-containing protein [Desulforudis sp.]MDP3049901.1 DUF1659 domain-containing protein [Eubacteriales bacterium]MDQ7790465.1 DUF1659 domain-containing protein [Clostridia bacterium]